MRSDADRHVDTWLRLPAGALNTPRRDVGARVDAGDVAARRHAASRLAGLGRRHLDPRVVERPEALVVLASEASWSSAMRADIGSRAANRRWRSDRRASAMRESSAGCTACIVASGIGDDADVIDRRERASAVS